jgi:hypothetical protein
VSPILSCAVLRRVVFDDVRVQQYVMVFVAMPLTDYIC